MSEARQFLERIIEEFDIDKFSRFFREKSRLFTPSSEPYSLYNDEWFTEALKIGDINFSESERFIVCSFNSVRELTERSSKKAQYEKAKKILKDTRVDVGTTQFI